MCWLVGKAVHHSFLFDQAHAAGFKVPAGKYYLADAGFSNCDDLLVPYQNVWYHLREWGIANERYCFSILMIYIAIILTDHVYGSPQNKEELFTL